MLQMRPLFSLQHLLAGLLVALRRGLQQFRRTVHRRAVRSAILRFIVTTVPLPFFERTVSASMKLSMIVKPIPLRSSPPVV